MPLEKAVGEGQTRRPGPQWIEVQPAAEQPRKAEAAITIRLGGAEVLLSTGFDREALRAVLDALEGR